MTQQKSVLRILLHGLVYFCRKFPPILAKPGWEFRHYDPNRGPELLPAAAYLQRCDLAYSWGGRLTMGKFLSVARLMRKKHLLMFWCGSDTLSAKEDFDAGRVDPWIVERVHHWAGAPWLAEEVQAMGLKCEYVPTTWVDVPSSLPPLPTKFSVLAHLSSADRVELYGIDRLFEVAKRMPHIEFNIVGILPGETLRTPDNVKVHKRCPTMIPFIKECTVLWRPARHDGLSFVALEALAHGRHVLWSYPFTGVTVAKSAASGYEEIQRLYELHSNGQLTLNRTGVEFIASDFAPKHVRERVLSRWRGIIQSGAEATETGFLGDQAVN